MKITIAGANGLIGNCLSDFLAHNGHEVIQLVRNPSESRYRQLRWNPYVGEIDASAVDGQDVIVNLAGKNVAAERWTDRVKKAIVQSRVQSTELIAQAMARVANRPKLLINASAVGYYGNRPATEVLIEESSPGCGFMAESCVRWENATKAAEVTGARVVRLRIGVVLAQKGGALERMLPFFRLGLGGRIASGKQMMSWIALEDIGPIIAHIIESPRLSGGVNITSPNPVSNAAFTGALAKALHRPAIFPVPAIALKIAFGEMAGEVLIGGANVIPRKLLDSGYRFRCSEIESTLSTLLMKIESGSR